jgi:hypothetical protein
MDAVYAIRKQEPDIQYKHLMDRIRSANPYWTLSFKVRVCAQEKNISDLPQR